MIKVITLKLIYNDEERRGEGTQEDVVRRIIKLHTVDGRILMVNDPVRRPIWEIQESVMEDLLRESNQ